MADIDAVYALGDGRYILSTYAAERLGSNLLRVKDGDLVIYDPEQDMAEHYLQESTFRRNNGALGGAADIDALPFVTR